jgi:hypothetical protein
MERVIQFVNDKFKNVRNSPEIQAQKEELIATLHDKIRDAMLLGKTKEQAFSQAVSTLSDMDELTEMLDG